MDKEFEQTDATVTVLGVRRPVLRFSGMLFVGELLSLVNPHGYGGRVWCARTLEKLEEKVLEHTKPLAKGEGDTAWDR